MDAGEQEFAKQLFGDIPATELTRFIATLEGVIERLRAVVATSSRQSPTIAHTMPGEEFRVTSGGEGDVSLGGST